MASHTYRVQFENIQEMAEFCGAFHVAYVPSDGPDHFIETDAPIEDLRRHASLVEPLTGGVVKEKLTPIEKFLASINS